MCVQTINPVFRDPTHPPTPEAVLQRRHAFHRAVTCCCHGNRQFFFFLSFLSGRGMKCHFFWPAVQPLLTNTHIRAVCEHMTGDTQNAWVKVHSTCIKNDTCTHSRHIHAHRRTDTHSMSTKPAAGHAEVAVFPLLNSAALGNSLSHS